MNFIGIDFGTHYCTVSLIKPNSTFNCSDSLIDSTLITTDIQILEYNIPSVIHIGEQILIGEDAVNLDNISLVELILSLNTFNCSAIGCTFISNISTTVAIKEVL